MKFLVNADTESTALGLDFARALGASVVVVESQDTRGSGETCAAQFRAQGIETRLILRTTGWLEALRETSRQEKFDLVIVAKMWQRGMRAFLFGKVPPPLLADIATNLLIVRRRREKICRLLAAVGGGPSGPQVGHWSALLATAFHARLTLLHVTERPPRMFTGLTAMRESLNAFLAADTPEARALEHAALAARQAGTEPELKLTYGLVADQILAEAQTEQYDLIILGSSFSAPASARLMMEGVTTRVVRHAPAPTLVIRGE